MLPGEKATIAVAMIGELFNIGTAAAATSLKPRNLGQFRAKADFYGFTWGEE